MQGFVPDVSVNIAHHQLALLQNFSPNQRPNFIQWVHYSHFSFFSLFLHPSLWGQLCRRAVLSCLPPSRPFTRLAFLTLPSWKPAVSFFGLATPPRGDLRAAQMIPRVLHKTLVSDPVKDCLQMLCALRQHNTPSFQASALGRVLCLMQHFVMRSPVSGDRRHKVYIKGTRPAS